MRSIVIALLCAWSVSPAAAQLPMSAVSTRVQPPRHLPRLRSPSGPALATSRIQSAVPTRLPASATPEAVVSSCPPEAVGAVCGYVAVPLDRTRPEAKKIQIHFELYTHSNSDPAESAILVNFGGPGETTTGDRSAAQSIFGPNMDVHDLLLVDDRGRGQSGAIDCEELQHGTAPFVKSMVDCAAQLGDAASRYGSGDIAEDTEAVRAALGYEKVDYYGGSYGGIDVTAFATRFGDHLRSMVLDAPLGVFPTEFARLRYRTQSYPRIGRLDCLRSPTCSTDHPDPIAELDQLVQAIRLHPVEGNAHDASGNLMHVRMDENALLNFVIAYPSGIFTSTGEILAAARSLKQGDALPLLRLGAEGFFTLIGDSGDPTVFSAGAFSATACADTHEPWDWTKPISERKEEYSEAVEDLPPHYFAPFSRVAPTGLLFSGFSEQCLWWEIPTPSSPVVEAHAVYPNVPTLVLDGDLDTQVPLEITSRVAALFPNSTFVKVAEVGHLTVGWTQCAVNLVSEFVETLRVRDTSCAKTPDTVWPALGRFPLLAEDARPAEVDPVGGNQIMTAESKVVTVVVAAATDALQRTLVGSGDGVGLRAGSFHTDYGPTGQTTTLTNIRFATDVTVSGTVTWEYFGSLVADLTVSGSGTAGGALHIEGSWEAPGPVGKFKVSGVLGGKQVAVLVPEA
jgi:pimeloyl-ACP methyl ester carboxylesterase